MGREVTLSQDEDSRRPMGFKLVKSSAYHSNPALISDSIHDSLEVLRLRHPHTVDMTDEMLHLRNYLGTLHFI